MYCNSRSDHLHPQYPSQKGGRLLPLFPSCLTLACHRQYLIMDTRPHMTRNNATTMPAKKLNGDLLPSGSLRVSDSQRPLCGTLAFIEKSPNLISFDPGQTTSSSPVTNCIGRTLMVTVESAKIDWLIPRLTRVKVRDSWDKYAGWQWDKMYS